MFVLNAYFCRELRFVAILRSKLRFLLRNTGVDSDFTQNFWGKNWRLGALYPLPDDFQNWIGLGRVLEVIQGTGSGSVTRWALVGRWGCGVIKIFWSIDRNDLWSKKICRPKMIVWSSATFILRWSFFLNQILLMFFFNQIARLLTPSEMVTKENPRKSPRQPPNSASREVKG